MPRCGALPGPTLETHFCKDVIDRPCRLLEFFDMFTYVYKLQYILCLGVVQLQSLRVKKGDHIGFHKL